MVSSFGTHSSGGLQCDHCDRHGHVEARCYKKKTRAQSRRGGRPSQGPGIATTNVDFRFSTSIRKDQLPYKYKMGWTIAKITKLIGNFIFILFVLLPYFSIHYLLFIL